MTAADLPAANMSDLDLVVALAQALRTTQQEGNTKRSRVLIATLRDELHAIDLALDTDGDACPAIIRSNGYLKPEWLSEIGVDPEFLRREVPQKTRRETPSVSTEPATETLVNRRVLDPAIRAEVFKFNKQYEVRAGEGRLAPESYDDAYRSAMLHNQYNGHRDPAPVRNGVVS